MRTIAASRLFPCLLSVLISSILLTSCGVPGERRPLDEVRELQSPAPSDPLQDQEPVSAYGPYKVGVRDILDIQVENHSELSGEFVVASDGTIALPYSGENLLLEGYALKETGARFAESVSPYTLAPPVVRAELISARSKFFYVLGAVNRTGRFAVGEKVVRLRDALVRAGLFNTNPWFRPAARKVYGITPHEETPTYVVVNARDVLLGKLRDDVIVYPDDIVYVPTTTYFKINVLLDEIVRSVTYISAMGAADEYFEEDFPEGGYPGRTYR